MLTLAKANARLRLVLVLMMTMALGAGMVVNGQLAAEAAPGTARLVVGERLLPGQGLVSPDGKLNLAMQGDGNLVLYAPGGAVRWHSRTEGNPGAYAQLQPDGNFVVYSTQNVALWSTATDGKGGAYAQIQDDGNFVVYNSAAVAVWESGTKYYPSRMGVGVLTTGQALQSPNGQYKAILQADGNFVLYGPNGWIWQSGTAGSGVIKLSVQPDGNMVMYSSTAVRWQSGTSGKGDGAYLQVQDDGNMVLYNAAAQWIWQTNTNSHSSGGALSSRGQIVVDYAMRQLNKPYRWGAVGPDAFDCSGLTQQAWAAAGVSIVHQSAGQYTSLPRVPYAQRQPGDILAWGTSTANGASVYHVAIYKGDNLMIEAPKPGSNVRVGPVRTANLMPYVLRPPS